MNQTPEPEEEALTQVTEEQLAIMSLKMRIARLEKTVQELVSALSALGGAASNTTEAVRTLMQQQTNRTTRGGS